MDSGLIIPFLFIGALIFIAFYIAFYIMRDAIYFFLLEDLGKINWLLPKNKQQFIQKELSTLSYYQNLSDEGKRYFFNRVIVFMLDKHFFGDGIDMCDEVKVFIASSAAQITFRIRGFYIDHIQLIRVFPQSVYSRLAQHKVKGLTTGAGVMWLSWQAIQEGYLSQTDGVNLALHEMAHAFMLSINPDDSPGRYLVKKFNNWKTASAKEYLLLKGGDTSFFREYGATNTDEFFAVSIECFFEKPRLFYEQFPDIYAALCQLLNQNPLNKADDYKFDALLPVENL